MILQEGKLRKSDLANTIIPARGLMKTQSSEEEDVR